MARAFHMGIDYGTSASKVVLRDFQAPGGEQAVALDYAGSPRIPSVVVVSDGFVLFGAAAAAVRDELARRGTDLSGLVFESIKMRVPDELQMEEGRPAACAAPAQQPPPDFTFQEMATLTVWWLIGQASELASRLAGRETTTLSMTLGIPMSFFADRVIRGAFANIARVAWRLFRDNGPVERPFLTSAAAKASLCAAEARVRGMPLRDSDVRAWVRSEAEAAMISSGRLPKVALSRPPTAGPVRTAMCSVP